MSDLHKTTEDRLRRASEKLRGMIQRFAVRNGRGITSVVGDLTDQRWCACDPKTINRDLGIGTRKRHNIPPQRVERYARWLHLHGHEFSPEEIAEWLDLTSHALPGELLLRITRGSGSDSELYKLAKHNLPRLGAFWGRQIEIEKAREWADDRNSFPIALLHGLGGNGKTTLQRKLGRDFLLSNHCKLRWPFEGVVSIPAYQATTISLTGLWRELAGLFDREEGLSPNEASSQKWIREVISELLSEKRILFMIDSFEDVAATEQAAILEYFTSLDGHTKLLLTSRSDLNYLLSNHQPLGLAEQICAIRIDGLSSDHVSELITSRIRTDRGYEPRQLELLARVTGNNPLAINYALGIVESQWSSLEEILDSLTSGQGEIFDQLFSKAWDTFEQPVQLVMMAKAFFSRPAPPASLGLIAGLSERELRNACDTLVSISFFEKESSEHLRINTHPLAQGYAHRMLKDDSERSRQMESRWWGEHALQVLKEASTITYESISAELKDSVDDMVAHIEEHLSDAASPHRSDAVNLVLRGEPAPDPPGNHEISGHGIGHVLRHWGKWDVLIKLAGLCLEQDQVKNDPRLLRECVLRLLTRAYYERRESREAASFIDIAYNENLRLKDKRLAAAIHYSRAELLRQQGKFKYAIDNLKAALEIFASNGNYTCDVAPTYMVLGGCLTELAAQTLEEPVDKAETATDALREAEGYLDNSERLLKSEHVDYAERSFDVHSIRAYRAVIARIRGDFVRARRLFEECVGNFPSISSVARLYRERALVEYLAGDRTSAHKFEDFGLALMEQVGVNPDQLPKYHCYRMIEQMKDKGIW